MPLVYCYNVRSRATLSFLQCKWHCQWKNKSFWSAAEKFAISLSRKGTRGEEYLIFAVVDARTKGTVRGVLSLLCIMLKFCASLLWLCKVASFRFHNRVVRVIFPTTISILRPKVPLFEFVVSTNRVLYLVALINSSQLCKDFSYHTLLRY